MADPLNCVADQGAEGEDRGRGGGGELHVGQGGAGGLRRAACRGCGFVRERLQRGAERGGRARDGSAGSAGGSGDSPSRARGGRGRRGRRGPRRGVLPRELPEGGGGRDGVPGRRGAVRRVLRRRAAAADVVVDRAHGALELNLELVVDEGGDLGSEPRRTSGLGGNKAFGAKDEGYSANFVKWSFT